MKMPDEIERMLFAPCGINCAVCYKHVMPKSPKKSCEGCLKGDLGKPKHCHQCKIKSCIQEKGYQYCFECEAFPCKQIKRLEKSYVKRYAVSLIENSRRAKAMGVAEFLEQDRKRWFCNECGGAYSLHDGVCSECGNGSAY